MGWKKLRKRSTIVGVGRHRECLGCIGVSLLAWIRGLLVPCGAARVKPGNCVVGLGLFDAVVYSGFILVDVGFHLGVSSVYEVVIEVVVEVSFSVCC